MRLGRDSTGRIKVTNQLAYNRGISLKTQVGPMEQQKGEAGSGDAAEARGLPSVRRLCCPVAGAEGPLCAGPRARLRAKGDLGGQPARAWGPQSLSREELHWTSRRILGNHRSPARPAPGVSPVRPMLDF